MSATNSQNKTYLYNASIHKTPKIKEIAACSSFDNTKDVPAHPHIVMDEYGQTPDHYYLAKKEPSFFQAKRKLDYFTYDSKVDYSKGNQRRLRKRGSSEKFGAKSAVDKPRYDTSLGQLTKKFLRLLSEANDGVINLNTACSLLAVPKRRLYDITNVLEGAGLIQKTSRNNIQWMGRVSSPCASLMKYELEREIDILEAKENKLDELIYHMKCEINTVKETDEQYHYITSDDIQSIEEFASKLLIGINMPSTVQIQESTERTLVVTSKSTEIETHYLGNDASSLNLTLPKQDGINSVGAYTFKIQRNNFVANTDVSKSIEIELSSDKILNPIETEENGSDPETIVGNAWTEFLEGDPAIKNAFITDEEDIAPIGKHFLLQTEDQDLDDFLPFTYLENSIDAYSFSLDVGEGLTDLYDCGFSGP